MINKHPWVPLSHAREQAIAAFHGRDEGDVEDALLEAFQDEEIAVRGRVKVFGVDHEWSGIIGADYWLSLSSGRDVKWTKSSCEFFADEWKIMTRMEDARTCSGLGLKAYRKDFHAPASDGFA